MQVTTDANVCEQLHVYRSLVQHIDQDLSSSELQDLKFLVRDVIPQARLEECSRFIDIITELEGRGEVSDVDTKMLAELLCRIGRNDLVKKLGYGVASFKKQISEAGSRLCPFRVLLHDLCEDLLKREVQDLLFISRDYLPASKLEGINTSQALFLALEKSEVLTPGDMSLMLDFMNGINRKDLVDKICVYNGVPLPNRVPVLHQLPQAVFGGGDGFYYAPDDYYKMDARPRGICLIINNYLFSQCRHREGAQKFKDRRGSQIDAESLRRTFTRLNMTVVIFENLTKLQILQTMAQFSQHEDHSSFDCFVCAILTHGKQEHVYGVDGESVGIKELTNYFKGIICPSLKGKPKMFFIQACQGTDKDEALRVEADSPPEEESVLPDEPQEEKPALQSVIQTDTHVRDQSGSGIQNGSSQPGIDMDANTYQQVPTLPNEADILIGYSTVPGFVSFRDIDEGSWYITNLCKALDRYALSEDLLSILTRVNREVSKEIYESQARKIHKQIPAPQYTLRKKVVFY